MNLHPVLARAAEGTLPPWAVAGPSRVAHARRVADVLAGWAEALAIPEAEAAIWRAAGLLHDALRDAEPRELRRTLGAEADTLADNVLHGPAAAKRLRSEGVGDEDFLRAVAFHTIGHPELDRMGRLLYVADFVEPGRRHRRAWLAELRDRMPEDRSAVLVEVATARIGRLLNASVRLPAETVSFWNGIVDPIDG